MESSHPFPPVARVATHSPADAWHHALGVAFLTSLVAAATGAVLYRFAGMSAWVIVPVLAFGGWVVGCHLTPASPKRWSTGPGTAMTLVEDDLSDTDARIDWSGDLAA